MLKRKRILGDQELSACGACKVPRETLPRAPDLTQPTLARAMAQLNVSNVFRDGRASESGCPPRIGDLSSFIGTPFES